MLPVAIQRRCNKGFTLIEMSVVLLVIGLLVAAVMVGKSMVRQSQLATVITDEQNYVAAAKQFQQKYGMLAGDFTGAQAIWGINPNCASYGAGTGTQTCNGNGDGQVTYFEELLFWQQLSNAQMVAGSYTGSSTNSNGYYGVPGVNIPRSRIKGGGFSFFYVGNRPTDGSLGNWFAGNYGHVIEFGAVDNTYYHEAWTPVLTIAEAASIDLKIDDGLPGTGNVLTQMSSAYACASTSNHLTAIYNITSVAGNQASCGLIFITGI